MKLNRTNKTSFFNPNRNLFYQKKKKSTTTPPQLLSQIHVKSIKKSINKYSYKVREIDKSIKNKHQQAPIPESIMGISLLHHIYIIHNNNMGVTIGPLKLKLQSNKHLNEKQIENA